MLVKEGTPGASVVALKRVNELDLCYNLGLIELATKVELSSHKTLAYIHHLKLRGRFRMLQVRAELVSLGFSPIFQHAITRIQASMARA